MMYAKAKTKVCMIIFWSFTNKQDINVTVTMVDHEVFCSVFCGQACTLEYFDRSFTCQCPKAKGEAVDGKASSSTFRADWGV